MQPSEWADKLLDEYPELPAEAHAAIAALIGLALAHERQACALFAREQAYNANRSTDAAALAQMIAEWIEARGQKQPKEPS